MLNGHFYVGAVTALLMVSPVSAGEITGNGKPIDVHARSICAYSGLNDTPEGDPQNRDPGGRVQSFGYLVGPWELYDPQVFDPQRPGPLPGWSCNPNRGPDLHQYDNDLRVRGRFTPGH
jgi:hypothetical protein